MKTILNSIVAAILGNVVWVLGLINLAWLLFKDHTLFSWWWVIGSALGFVLFLVLALIFLVKQE